jgi:hypothetical protein
MTWTGDIYEETCGDYRIKTTYSHLGAFSSISYCGRNIGYRKGIEEAKELCDEHAERNGVVTE